MTETGSPEMVSMCRQLEVGINVLQYLSTVYSFET